METLSHSTASRDTAQSLFILSSERSGSTLLRYIVDTHPLICCPAEVNLGQLCEDLSQTLYFTMGQVLGTEDKAERSRVVLMEVRRIVSGIMDSYAVTKNKPLWCEKSPMNLLHLDILWDLFPDKKYICLHRNCMDVVHSLMETNRLGWWDHLAPFILRNTDNTVAAMIEYWIERTERILAFEKAHPEQCFRIKYQSLIFYPAETLSALFKFAGVEWDPALLDSIFKAQHDAGPGDTKAAHAKKINKNSVGKGSSIPLSKIPTRLRARMNSLHEALGYPIVGDDWDQSPSPYILQAEAEAEASFKAAASAPPDSNISEKVTYHLNRRLQEQKETLKQINAVCKLVVRDEGQRQTWMIDMTSPAGSLTRGDGQADCTVELSERELLALMEGKVNPMDSFYRGTLRITGNMALVSKIGEVLF